MNLRTLAAAATFAALTLTGCSDTVDQPEAATPGATVSPETPEAPYTEIPASTIKAYFPETASGPDNRWTRIYNGTGPNDRVLMPCGTEEGLLAIDREATTFAHTSLEDDGYLIQRQLTLYPDTETAEQFVAQMEQGPIGCDWFGDDRGAMSPHDFGPDRLYGVQDETAVFSHGFVQRGTKGKAKDQFRWTDVVSTRGNAVMLTRVGRSGHAPSLVDNQRNLAEIRRVRTHGNESVEVLDTLR